MVNQQVLGLASYLRMKLSHLSMFIYFNFSIASGLLIGTVYGGLDNPKVTYTGNVKLRAGINKISLLSVAVGLPVSVELVLLSFFTS